ncbi:MAG TPA: alpha/beta fold hydrolase [Acidimicrobiia bacterium]|jgi:pimeloyl-ACP methyl ester carboxylesterase/predicted amino acid-binding ACT domain protein|nr:alpha/beta fold hydrolase [Acidimicrobiia bacterium]
MVGVQLSSLRVEVEGRGASYRAGGEGPPVLFLHGWALGTRAYQRVVRRLTGRGCRVYAPAMPGFAGTADLPPQLMTMAGYGDWVDKFMQAVDIEEPALVIGHSFGGGVAIKLAHDHPDRVGYLVLLNSVGGVTNRPLWEWVWRFWRELFPNRQGIEIARAMRDDLVTNLVRNPLGVARAGELARSADLREELTALRERELPVLALTTQNDGVIPSAAFEALCSAVGTEGRVVSGRHSWLLTDPDSFDNVLANVVEVRVGEHQASAATSRASRVADALAVTNIPARRARTWLRDAPTLWFMSAPPEVLAGDLALCHPKLESGEVRAVARPIDGSNAIRLTVAAPDRRGLLGDTTGVLAGHGLCITDASAATWTKQRLALHALTLEATAYIDETGWKQIGEDLRAICAGAQPARPNFLPIGRATVTAYGSQRQRTLIRVLASDQIGLLSTICRWFADHDLSVESLHAATDGEIAHDVFLVQGSCDARDLARHLSRR